MIVRLLHRNYDVVRDELRFRTLDADGRDRTWQIDMRHEPTHPKLVNISFKTDDEVIAILREIDDDLKDKWKSPAEFERDERQRKAPQIAPPLPDIDL